MVRFGIIGTNTITEKFLKGASHNKDFKLEAVYSRTEERAKAFAEKYKADNIFTDLERMAESNIIDAVYIASPNSFHSMQSIIFLKNRKHVLCEKAVASNQKELKKVIETAEENNVLFMEAIKSIAMPSFTSIKNNLYKIGTVRRYFGNYCQYSSRYDKYKEGIILNAFNPELSNGSLMDIGVYCIHPLVQLFGMPQNIKANGLLLESGVDGQGSIILKYDDMDGLLMYSKIANSYIPSEIQGENGSIIIDSVNIPKDIKIHYKDGTIEDISVNQINDSMYYELTEFIDLINIGQTESSLITHKVSMDVMRIMDEVRNQIGLVYKAD